MRRALQRCQTWLFDPSWLSLDVSTGERGARSALAIAAGKALGWGLVVTVATGGISGFVILFLGGPSAWMLGLVAGIYFGLLVGVPATVLTTVAVLVMIRLRHWPTTTTRKLYRELWTVEFAMLAILDALGVWFFLHFWTDVAVWSRAALSLLTLIPTLVALPVLRAANRSMTITYAIRPGRASRTPVEPQATASRARLDRLRDAHR